MEIHGWGIVGGGFGEVCVCVCKGPPEASLFSFCLKNRDDIINEGEGSKFEGAFPLFSQCHNVSFTIQCFVSFLLQAKKKIQFLLRKT